MTKVLLVEDDNNLREIYEARLAAEGYEIATAKDGEDALAVAKQQKPDLIISDVMMPRISGFEMLDILRNTDGLKHAKVIMLTALGQNEDKTRADNLGADRYLVKSQVTLEDIVKTADELLNPDAHAGSTAENVSETPAAAPQPEPAAVQAEPSQQAAAPTAPANPDPQQAAAPAAPAPVPQPAAPGVVTSPMDPNAGTDMPVPSGAMPTITSNSAPVDNTAQPADPAAAASAPGGLNLPDPTQPAASQPDPTATAQPTVPATDTTVPVAEPPATPAPETQPDLSAVGAPASEPHTVITPPSQEAPQEAANPAPAETAAAPAAAPPEAEPSDTPFITQPQPQAQPETVPADTSSDNELPVTPAPEKGQPAETTDEASTPEVQMPENPEIAAAAEAAVPVEAQPVSQEEATVEQQIEDFVNQHQDATPAAASEAAPEAVPTTEAAQPEPSVEAQLQPETAAPEAAAVPAAPEQGNNNEQLIANAMNDLLAGSNDTGTAPAQNEPVEANPQNLEVAAEPSASDTSNDTQAPPQTANAFNPAETQDTQASVVSDGNPQIPGRKVVQPIVSNDSKPDLSELVAKEEVKESIEKGTTGEPVVADTVQQAPEPAPSVMPMSPPPAPHASQQPGGVFTPNNGGDADQNAL